VTQLSIFDALRAPPIIRPVDRDGHVLQGKAHHTLALPHPRLAWDLCRIELHPTRQGLWMWSVTFNTGYGGAGYKVGEKWGHFALSAEDALHYALEELRGRLGRAQLYDNGARKIVTQILTWAESLTLEARQ
jgi:hypothetical protein